LSFDIATLAFIIGAFIIFLLLREFNCWYWKINERVALLDEILVRLEKLEPKKEASKSTSRFPEINID
jgi:hypothetical protein